MEKCLPSFVIREMQVKTECAATYLLQWLTFLKVKILNVGEDVEQVELSLHFKLKAVHALWKTVGVLSSQTYTYQQSHF